MSWRLGINKEKNIEIEAKLVRKYGGLKVKDLDQDTVVLTFSETSAVFEDCKGPSNIHRAKGYYLYAMKEGVSENDFEQMEQWPITEANREISNFENAAVQMIYKPKSSSNFKKKSLLRKEKS